MAGARRFDEMQQRADKGQAALSIFTNSKHLFKLINDQHRWIAADFINQIDQIRRILHGTVRYLFQPIYLIDIGRQDNAGSWPEGWHLGR